MRITLKMLLAIRLNLSPAIQARLLSWNEMERSSDLWSPYSLKGMATLLRTLVVAVHRFVHCGDDGARQPQVVDFGR